MKNPGFEIPMADYEDCMALKASRSLLAAVNLSRYKSSLRRRPKHHISLIAHSTRLLKMNHSSDDSPQNEQGEILFQSDYGGYPKYALYTLLPFLLLLAGGLLVYAIGFNGGIAIRGIKVSPAVVAYGICPVIFLLCAIVVGSEIYRRFHPQRIVITEDGLILPKGRFTNDEIHIRWNDLTATMTIGSFAVIDVYDVACKDSSHKTTTGVSTNSGS